MTSFLKSHPKDYVSLVVEVGNQIAEFTTDHLKTLILLFQYLCKCLSIISVSLELEHFVIIIELIIRKPTKREFDI
jgi:hypothetical protein